jgi:hypothetical protein
VVAHSELELFIEFVDHSMYASVLASVAGQVAACRLPLATMCAVVAGLCWVPIHGMGTACSRWVWLRNLHRAVHVVRSSRQLLVGAS